MPNKKVLLLVALVMIFSTVLGACAPATDAPVEEPEAPAEGEKTKLVIYTAKENEEIEEFVPIAQAALPHLELEVLRLSTGDLTARLLAEKDNPQADLIWGMAATSLIIFKNEGMLEPYAPAGLDGIEAGMRDPDEVPSWVGDDAYLTAICVNTEIAEEHNLPMPTSWEDLLDPVYKDHIIMPNPASSGTGFMFVSSVLQGLGEDEGWAYLDELDKNMALYTKSGSKPCKMAGAGEFAIGISFAFVGARLKRDGAPIEFVLPAEGAGFEVEANGLLKGANNPEGAKQFLDWAISDEALGLYAQYFAVVSKPGFPIPEGMPDDVVERLFHMDFQWSSDNRDAILETWSTQYAEKTVD
ncbi:MAG: putative 2-aminoethylphosphonate ABC transporter substrate-binding protein [Chloroflexota bacterium]